MMAAMETWLRGAGFCGFRRGLDPGPGLDRKDRKDGAGGLAGGGWGPCCSHGARGVQAAGGSAESDARPRREGPGTPCTPLLRGTPDMLHRGGGGPGFRCRKASVLRQAKVPEGAGRKSLGGRGCPRFLGGRSLQGGLESVSPHTVGQSGNLEGLRRGGSYSWAWFSGRNTGSPGSPGSCQLSRAMVIGVKGFPVTFWGCCASDRPAGRILAGLSILRYSCSYVYQGDTNIP